MKEKLEKVLQKVWINIKRIGKEIAYFLSSKIFLRNFAGIFVFLTLMLFIVLGWLNCYTKHGESIQVHNYIGLDLEDAERKAKDRSFSIVVNDSLFVVNKEPNTVLDQNPKPKSKVKENRTIYLTISKRTADPVTLPNLTGGNDDYSTYERKLKRSKVTARIIGRQYNNKLAENTILEVIYRGDTITSKLKDGFIAEKGDVVDFIVSERGGSRVPIPELVCQKYDAAKFLITNYNLNIGSVIPDNTVTDIQSAYIWKQKPSFRPSKNMRIGEQVDLYLTQYLPDGCSGVNQNEVPVDRMPEQPSSIETPDEF